MWIVRVAKNRLIDIEMTGLLNIKYSGPTSNKHTYPSDYTKESLNCLGDVGSDTVFPL